MKFLKKSLKLFLSIVVTILEDSSKRKIKHPTQAELMYGEKLFISDEYFFPDEKHDE